MWHRGAKECLQLSGIISTLKCVLIILTLLGIQFAQAQVMEELGQLYGQAEYELVIKKGKEVLSNGEYEPQVGMIVGRSLADSEQYKEAIPYLKKVLDYHQEPDWVQAWSLGYLGTCYFMLGDLANAKNSLQKCLDLNATRNVNKYAGRRAVLFGTHEFYDYWVLDSTSQIVFHFQRPDRLPQDKEVFMEKRQKALEVILEAFPVELPKKIDFFVWNSRDKAKEVLGRTIGFAEPSYLLTHSRKNQTTGHEIAHIVTYHALKQTSKTRFINEGIATYYDQSGKNRMETAINAIKEFEIQVSMQDLWGSGRNYPESIVYPVGAAWIEFCYERIENEQLVKLFQNQTFNYASGLLGPKLEELIAEFETQVGIR